ncbi:MAG: efflux RND transporter periplasmic adaptor subunit [Ruminococcus sp.]
MGRVRKIVIGTTSVITAAAVAAGGFFWWKSSGNSGKSDGVAYVCAVSGLNTAVSSAANMQFSGVVEPQQIKEVKADLSKTISEVAVEEGVHVNEGDVLFSYDIEAMELEMQQGEVEIEQMENEITSNEQQISKLESEKNNANADDQLTYTTQIQSLETSIAKTKYDIKTKKIELEKLKKTIKNASVKAEISGTVQSLKTTEQMQSEGSDVVMKIMSDGEFRVKCMINEQNMYMIYAQQPVQIHSRIDDTVWNGTITEISTEAENDQNNMFYYADEMTTSSKYSFYIMLESGEGLMLGQHVLVTPDQGSTVQKDGIWLYSDYVITDDNGDSFVWAAGSGDKLEKRKVEIGQKDEMMGDCEIVSGLEEEDLIAFPSDFFKEGIRTTTNAEDAFDPGDEEIPADEDIPADDVMPVPRGLPAEEDVIIREDNAEDTFAYDEGGESDDT